MKKLIIASVTFIFFSTLFLKADEGMWMLPLLEQLNMENMHELGLELSSDQIYSINNSSIKDAIVIFGGGCTAEIISDKGLLLTNHHCGYGIIQSHSTVEDDYLTDGFWAESFENEIPSPQLSVTFLIRIEDVTNEIISELNDGMTEQERSIAVRVASGRLENDAVENTHYFARVQPFFAGNQYYMMVYERFNDVRLVGTPPSSIGKFGGDTDNWMWPRQTGDFALFRVYTAADGSPAEYSEDNIPLRPKYHLPVSTRGIEAGDFAMVLGYPGGTSRYMTSFEIDELLEITHPNRVKIRGPRQEIMLEDMLASDRVRIQYANKYSGSSNYWKFSIGQGEILKRLGIYQQKREQEQIFSTWAESDPLRHKSYGDALSLIENAIQSRRDYNNALQYINEAILRSCEIVIMASRANMLYQILSEESLDKASLNFAVNNLRNSGRDFYKDYNPSTDRKIVAAMLKLFYDDVDRRFHPDIMEEVYLRNRGDFSRFSDKLFRRSVFASEDKFQKFLDNPSARILEKDMAFRLARSTFSKAGELRERNEHYSDDLSRGQRLYTGGLMEKYPDRVFYPDANFTMRLTYGTVEGYQPRDAVWYDYSTTLGGVMEKEDPSGHEFIVPQRLKDLYGAGNFGEYAKDGIMPVNFITNNDITGGNSGSPVINARGELTGLAFDGNWEAMSGDIAFEPELQRCIAVDARYILFIIDRFAGATHLIDEMTIVH